MTDRSKLIDSLRVEIELAEKVGATAAVVSKMEKDAQKIQRAIDRLNARGPTEQMSRLEKAIEQMGGAGNISETQTMKLADEVERLARAGAKVPASLQPALEAVRKLKDAEKLAEVQLVRSIAVDKAHTQAIIENRARVAQAAAESAKKVAEIDKAQTQAIIEDRARRAKGTQDIDKAHAFALSEDKTRTKAAAADLAALKQGILDKVGLGSLTGMGPAAGGLLAVGAMAGVAKETFDLINSTADLADNVSDLATKYQISTDSVQQFQFMADRAGLTVDDFGAAIVTLTKNLDQAPEKFREWGMDVEHLKSLKPDELLGAMAEKLKTLNESDRLTFSKELMKGTELLPVLLDDFDQLVAKARELGVNLSEADISSLKGLRENIDDIGTAWEGMWVSVGASLAQSEEVQDFFSYFAAGIVELANIIKENRSEIVGFAKLLTGMATMNPFLAGRGIQGLLSDPEPTTYEWGTDPTIDPKKKPGLPRPDAAANAAAERAAKAAMDLSVANTQMWSDFVRSLAKKAQDDVAAMRGAQHAKALKGLTAGEMGFTNDLLFGPADVKKRSAGFDTVGIIKDIQGVEREIFQLHEPTMQWSQFLQDAAAQFQLMGASGQAIGKIVGAMGGLGSIFGQGGALQGVTGVKSFLSGGLSLAKLSGGLSAAFAAIDVGKMIFSMFHKTEAQKVAFDVGRDYGVKISEGLSKEIAEKSKTMGREAASLLSLDKIVAEGGGVQAFGVEKTAAKLRDLFSMIQTGKMTADQAKGPFDKLFGEVAQASISKTTGLISAQAAELRDLADASGMKSDAVEKFKNEQRDVASTIIERLAKSDKGFTNAGESEAVGNAVAAQFERYVKAGLSGVEIAEKMGPLIESLQDKFHRAGVGGGKAFEAMLGKVEVFRDELTGPVAQGFQDTIGLAAALFNAGDLTKSQFQGLASSAASSFGELQGRLASEGKDPNAAFEMMAGDLQKLWEMQRRFNVDLDENTKKMLAEAQAQGVVGEEFMDPLLREAERTNEILERGFTHLGASFDDMPGKLNMNLPTDLGPYAPSGGVNAANLADALKGLGEGGDGVGAQVNDGLSAVGTGMADLGAGLVGLATQPIMNKTTIVLPSGAVLTEMAALVTRGGPEATAMITAIAEQIKARG